MCIYLRIITFNEIIIQIKIRKCINYGIFYIEDFILFD
jgi:hypothetical protein